MHLMTTLDHIRLLELDAAAANCPAGNSWHDRALELGLACECGAFAPPVQPAPKRRRFPIATVAAAVALVVSAAFTPTTVETVAQVDVPNPPPASSDIVMPGENLVADPPGCVSAYRGEPGEDPTVAYCDQYQVDTDRAYDPVAACLITLGYHGRPDDQRETIYSTARDIEWCADINAPMDANQAAPLREGTWTL